MSNLRGLQKSKNLRSIRFCRFDSFNALKGMTRITWSAFYSSVSFREPTQSDQIRINLSYGSVRPSPGFYHGSITEIYFQISLRNMSHSPRFITLQNSFWNFLTKYFRYWNQTNQEIQRKLMISSHWIWLPRMPILTMMFEWINQQTGIKSLDQIILMKECWKFCTQFKTHWSGIISLNNVILIHNLTCNVYQV